MVLFTTLLPDSPNFFSVHLFYLRNSFQKRNVTPFRSSRRMSCFSYWSEEGVMEWLMTCTVISCFVGILIKVPVLFRLIPIIIIPQRCFPVSLIRYILHKSIHIRILRRLRLFIVGRNLLIDVRIKDKLISCRFILCLLCCQRICSLIGKSTIDLTFHLKDQVYIKLYVKYLFSKCVNL